MARIMVLLAETEAETVGSVEELFLAKAQLKTIDTGYQDLNLETPEWVIDKINEVEREITSRVSAELKRRLKVAMARRSQLRTADEKRKDLDTEIAALQNQLK